MLAVVVFLIIFLKLGCADQLSSSAAGSYQIRIDEC